MRAIFRGLLRAAAAIAVAAQAACGTQGGTAPGATSPKPPPVVVRPPTGGSDPGRLPAALAGFRAAWSQVRTASGVDDSWQTKGSSRYSVRVDFKSRGPKALRMDVRQSSKADEVGSVLAWAGGPEVQIKVKLGFLPVTVSRPLTHGDVISLRGYRLDQTSFNAAGDALLAGASQSLLVGDLAVSGKPALLLQVPGKLAGAEYERIALDSTTHLPVYRELRDSRQAVYGQTFSNLRVNATFGDDAFRL